MVSNSVLALNDEQCKSRDSSSVVALPLVRDLTTRGFDAHALTLLERAVGRGHIFSDEVTAMLSSRVVRSPLQLRSAVVYLKGILDSFCIPVVSGREALKLRPEGPPKTHRSPKVVSGKTSRPLSIFSDSEAAPDFEGSNGNTLVLPIDQRVLMVMSDNDPDRHLGGGFGATQRALNRFPILPRDEVLELGRQVREEHSLQARNKLVVHNWKLVMSIALVHLGRGLDIEDLFQEGVMGIIHAAEKFDHRKGFAFTTYATWWIKQSIERALMNLVDLIRLPVHLQEALNKLFRAGEDIAKQTGRQPTADELALATGMTIQDVKKTLKTMRFSILFLDFKADSKERDEDRDLHECITDIAAAGPAHLLEAKEEISASLYRINQVLETIKTIRYGTESHQAIFRFFYGLDDFASVRTLEQTGQKFHLTRERIRQIIARLWEELIMAGVDMDDDSLRQEVWRVTKLRELTHEEVSLENSSERQPDVSPAIRQ